VEVEADLKVLKTKFAKAPTELTLFEKATLVERFISAQDDLGTVDHHGRFFAGELEMSWGTVVEGLVYFAGSTDKTALGLGGSVRHLVGAPPSDFPLIGSELFMMYRALASVIKDDSAEPTDEPNETALRAVERFARGRGGPTQRVRFVAKRLLYGPAATKSRSLLGELSNIEPPERPQPQAVLLGSPLFVSLAT